MDLSPYINIDIPVLQFDFSPFVKKQQEATDSAVRPVAEQQAAYQSALIVLLAYRANRGIVFSDFRQKIADLVIGSDNDIKSNTADIKFAASLVAATKQISQKQERAEKRKEALDAAKKNLPKDVPAGFNNLKSPPGSPVGQQIRNQLMELDKLKATPGISEAEQSYIAKAEDLIKKADQQSDDQSGQEAKNLLILAQEYIDMAGRKNVNWKEASRKKVECPQKEVTPRERNRLISAEYAALYLSDPSVYKWAGMAAFASDLVGIGIQFGEFLKYYPDYANVVQQTEEFLAAGNAAVFNDIYWQHEAYRVGGLEEMKRLRATEQIVQDQIEAWELIDKGNKNGDANMIWLGNKKLLRYEQFITLQPIYEKFSDLSKLISPFMISPIPGNLDPFQVAVPLGNIGDKNDRWNWIAGSMLPSWNTLSDKDRGKAMSELTSIVENSKGVCKQ